MAMTERVLIAGAGPVGLVAALDLARRGIAVTVVEAEPVLTEDLRASTFHPPTLDMLDALGVTGGLIARHSPVMPARPERPRARRIRGPH